MTQYGTVHEEILSLLETDKIEAEVINHMKSLEPTYQVLAQAELKLEQLKHSQYVYTASLPTRLPSGGEGGHSSSNSQLQAHCKLPKIGLPQYVPINDIDKFNYLKGCLKGEARATIFVLTLSSVWQ